MSIIDTISNSLVNRTSFTVSDLLKSPELSVADHTSLQTVSAGQNEKSPTQKILSSQESSILHALFGTEMPTESTVYGKNKIQQIHKGHLVDIIG